MFSLTKKTDYALVAMARLAEARRACDNDDESAARMSARQIAAQYEMPLPLLMNILKDLQKGGLVSSTRGAHGGYYLARHERRISIADVMHAIEGNVLLTECCGSVDVAKGGHCPLHMSCPIKGVLNTLHLQIHSFLENVSIADLLDTQQNAMINVGMGLSLESSEAFAKVDTQQHTEHNLDRLETN